MTYNIYIYTQLHTQINLNHETGLEPTVECVFGLVMVNLLLRRALNAIRYDNLLTVI